MTNNSSQNGSTPLTTRGFAMPIVIAIVALVIVVGGIGYFATRTKPLPTATTQTPAGEKTLSDGTMVKADGTMVKPDGTMIKPDGTMVKPDGTMEKKEGEAMMKKEGEAMSAEGGSASGGMAKYTGTILAGKSAPLLDYNKADYDAALKSDKLVVLYFYANWCPVCKEETANALYPAFNELTTEKVIGIRINYNDSDTDQAEKDLAKQFGVAYQHTKVFVKNGNRVLKSPEGWDKNRYLSEINKVI